MKFMRNLKKKALALGVLAGLSVCAVGFAAPTPNPVEGEIRNAHINGTGDASSIACQMQWNGTEWVLVGTPGPQGPQGEQGIPGEQGTPGANGDSVSISSEDYTDPKTEKTGTKVTVTNIPGDGSESTSKSFYVMNGDKGDKGDKGDTGATGAKGDKGDKGDTGATGAKGDKGDTGAKGDKGDQGIQGEKGDTGAKGDKGDQGIQGEKGDTGAKGDKGDTGAKGDKGDQGIQGEKGDSIVGGEYAVQDGEVRMDIQDDKGEVVSEIVITNILGKDDVRTIAEDSDVYVDSFTANGAQITSVDSEGNLTLELGYNKLNEKQSVTVTGIASTEYVNNKVTEVNEKIETVDQKVDNEIERATNEENKIWEELKKQHGDTNIQINKLSNEIDTVGALSAAMAGLHPRFQDGNKGEVAAAVGTYDGKKAMAIGGFYAPNEQVMFSIGAAIANGGGKMANLGVNFALDRTKDRKAAPKDIVYTRKEVDQMLGQQAEQIAALMAEIQALKAGK